MLTIVSFIHISSDLCVFQTKGLFWLRFVVLCRSYLPSWAGPEAPRWQDAKLRHVLSWACGSSRRRQDGGREPHGGSWWICFEFLICFDNFWYVFSCFNMFSHVCNCGNQWKSVCRCIYSGQTGCGRIVSLDLAKVRLHWANCIHQSSGLDKQKRMSEREGENIAMAGSLTLFQPLEPCCSCLVSLRNL